MLNRIRGENKLLFAYFAVMIIIQAVFARLLAYEPNYDVKNVFFGAIQLAETGKLSEELTRYFSWAQNNFNLAFIMSIAFRIVGIVRKSYFMIFAFANIALVNLAVYCLYDLIRRVCGIKIAYFALAVLFFYIPMYFFPSMIYTDTTTMWAPVICLNLFTRLKAGQGPDGMGRKRKIAYSMLLGAFGALGYAIKPTAAIMFIAIVIICCVFVRKLEVYKLTALSVAVFIAVTALFQIPYRVHVPKDVREANSIPYSHWVMMGLQNSGQVSWSEFAVTMSFPTYAEKNENAVNTIKARLSDMGAKGFALFAQEKIEVLYSEPDFQPNGIITFTGKAGAARLNNLREHNSLYGAYNSIVFYGAVYLAIASILFRTRNHAAYLALFGVNLFFLFWEVNPKYLTNYFFVFIFMACLTIKAAADFIKGQAGKAFIRDSRIAKTAGALADGFNKRKAVKAAAAVVITAAMATGYALTPKVAYAVPSPLTVAFGGAETDFDVYSINGNNYVRLGDVAYMCSGTGSMFGVDNRVSRSVYITKGNEYTPVGGEMAGRGDSSVQAYPAKMKVYIDGERASVAAYDINGHVYFHLAELVEALDLSIEYDAERYSVEFIAK